MARRKEKNKDRHLELCSKFMEMGHALIKEGDDKKDYVISQSGSFFILLAGVMFSEEDIFELSELCSMFSAKKVLDNMRENNHPLIMDMKNNIGSDTYENMVKRINQMRKDNGLGPIQH